MLYPPSWYFTQHCFWLRNSLHSTKIMSMCSQSWNSLFSMTEWYNSFLKTQLQYQLGGNTLPSWGKILQRLHMLWITIQYMVLFLPQPGLMGPGIKKWKWEWYHLLLPLVTHPSKIVASCYHDLILCCPRGFSSKRRNAFTRRYNNVSIKLKVKTVAQPFWAPYASKSTGKEGS